MEEKRRETNRQSARKYTHKNQVRACVCSGGPPLGHVSFWFSLYQHLIEQLRALAAELENRYSANRPFLRYVYPPQQSQDADSVVTIEVL